jgi:hypothetical protein
MRISERREGQANQALMERQAKWSLNQKYNFAKELTKIAATILQL